MGGASFKRASPAAISASSKIKCARSAIRVAQRVDFVVRPPRERPIACSCSPFSAARRAMCRWAPCREKGQAAVGNVAADQKTPRPFPGEVIIVFTDLEIGQLEIGPVVPARTFGPFAGRQAAPGLLRKALRDRGGGAGDRLLLAPGMEDMIGSNTQNIAFARRRVSVSPVPYTLSAATNENGIFAAIARAII